MMEDRHSNEHQAERPKEPEARFSYYRRCQEFRKNGDQCKAPAETGTHICYAHAGQQAMAKRRERERRAVLAEAVAQMRRLGKPECEAKDLFMDFIGIQVTLAVMAQALIDGRIDCKTAGRLAVDLQTVSKLLWMIHRKGRSTLPLMNTDHADLKNAAREERRNHTAEARSHGEKQISPQIFADERRLSKQQEVPGVTPNEKVLTTKNNRSTSLGHAPGWARAA